MNWLARMLEPLGSLLSAIGRFLGWLFDILFGWLPSIDLPFDIPDWVWTTAKISVLALLRSRSVAPASNAGKNCLRRRALRPGDDNQ